MASFRQIEDQGRFILYDPEHIPQIHADWFNLEYWQKQQALLGGAPGRGTSVFLESPAGELVWRHYHRGGLPGKLIKDRYFGRNLESSRPWREMHLTQQLYDWGLPVPKPLAAAVQPLGLTYRADLMTARLVDALPLADYLLATTPQDQQQALQAAAAVIKRFHQVGLNHTDLNPRNILINPKNLNLWVIDFDRCFLSKPAAQTARQNLNRLHRALIKLNPQEAGQWQTWLLQAYQAS